MYYWYESEVSTCLFVYTVSRRSFEVWRFFGDPTPLAVDSIIAVTDMAHCQCLVAFFPLECFLQKALFWIGNDHSPNILFKAAITAS